MDDQRARRDRPIGHGITRVEPTSGAIEMLASRTLTSWTNTECEPWNQICSIPAGTMGLSIVLILQSLIRYRLRARVSVQASAEAFSYEFHIRVAKHCRGVPNGESLL